MIRFDPKRILEKWWRNMRDSEEMVNIDIKYWAFISWESLDMEPPVFSEQLSFESIDTKKRSPLSRVLKKPEKSINELKKLRKNLWAVMAEYSKRFRISLSDVEKELYRKFSVWSRLEMSSSELEWAIESYKTALNRNLA